MVVQFKNRLARFGFTYIECYFNAFGVKVELVSGEETESLRKELVQDMLSVLAVFSTRLYGSRSREFCSKVKEAIADEAKGEQAR